MNPPRDIQLILLSDIHYAAAAERARGNDYEIRVIQNPLVRAFARLYRNFIWMRHPLERGRQLDRFLAECGPAEHVIVNGDHAKPNSATAPILCLAITSWGKRPCSAVWAG